MSIFSACMLACVGVLLTACAAPAGSDQTTSGCADVVGVDAQISGDGTYRFDVTVASADTGWEKYADAWEVRTHDGVILATRELAHPHVDEQPFTRSLSGIRLPSDVTSVTVRARDSVAGFCGKTVTLSVH